MLVRVFECESVFILPSELTIVLYSVYTAAKLILICFIIIIPKPNERNYTKGRIKTNFGFRRALAKFCIRYQNLVVLIL